MELKSLYIMRLATYPRPKLPMNFPDEANLIYMIILLESNIISTYY
uniref:Uncharacterized protein n=1 Tax=Candidatus Kentrum sp. SD TaxID=2126332 RepID=A0A451BQF4_9GAMM|nr:MAG: hypothetical protein BECKSD772F_GA0070984_11252 [Candidatus Kentron sp. SD]VFK48378.1 MAG: hypothetical protein BECKSD772E_GA0070983_11232 [Candidatus Kentron sp. SD]VFK80485.1 MAG: hypothetical protein BECKSD772D_GA0070982_11199 [Candidatus Kentron sp. SD]